LFRLDRHDTQVTPGAGEYVRDTDMTNDDKRLEIAAQCAAVAWKLANAEAESIESVVVVIGDEGDANARVLLRALHIRGQPVAAEMNLAMVSVPRDRAIAEIAPLDAELASGLRTPTPMKLTVLVIAYGGWSVCGMGRNVGSA